MPGGEVDCRTLRPADPPPAPHPDFWLLTLPCRAGATLLVVAVGARLIRSRRSALLAPYRPAAERVPPIRAL
jgi:hypothetical protein